MKNNMNKEEVKVAYLLLAHNKPEQLNLFIRQLKAYGDCDIYIHVDKKNQSMIDSIEKDTGVYLISKYEVSWASFSMIEATIELMQAVVNSRKRYSHVYYGSGDDLLVKNGMYEYLAEHPHSVFMNLYWGGWKSLAA